MARRSPQEEEEEVEEEEEEEDEEEGEEEAMSCVRTGALWCAHKRFLTEEITCVRTTEPLFAQRSRMRSLVCARLCVCVCVCVAGVRSGELTMCKSRRG